MPFGVNFPATHTALMNNITDMLMKLVDITSRLIYGGAHKIISFFRMPPLTEIDEEPHNVSQEAEVNEEPQTHFDFHEGENFTILNHEQMHAETQSFNRPEIQHPTTMENLPDDLLSNILTRLLAKQLTQLKCVSKSWNTLLSQSSFVKSHLHHSINSKDRILLVFYNDVSSHDLDDPEPISVLPYRSPHLHLYNFIELPTDNLNYAYTTSMIEIIGSIHGLICSHYDYDLIHIWNPSLSLVSTLPPHYIPSRGSYVASLRFGFDPKTEDYKVVILIGLIEPPRSQSSTVAHVVKDWLQGEVYSMRKNSWELITQRLPSHITNIFEHDYVCVDGHDGHIHWHSYSDEEGEVQTIVAFDLGLETFCEIPFPDSVLDGEHSNLLGVLGGKLCVMAWYREDVGCEVWVMDEYGVAESWVKFFVFSLYLDDVICGFTSHNEFVILDNDCHLILYDPTANKDKKILYEFHIRNYSTDKLVEYVDSLVWIGPGGYDMIDGAR